MSVQDIVKYVKESPINTNPAVIKSMAEQLLPKLQEKTATENGEVVPDAGYNGLSKVSVNIDIPDEISLLLGEARAKMFKEDNDLRYAFCGLHKITTVPLLDTSKVRNMQNMFKGCRNLTTVPPFDTSNVTVIGGMFDECRNLTTVPLFNTSNVKSMVTMFQNCSSLTTVPLFDTSKIYNMYCMFSGCSNLTTVPLFNTSNVNYMESMFQNCANLISVPDFDTSNVTNMSNMFYGCTNLTTVPGFDVSNMINMYHIFYGCTNLTECWLRNIKIDLQVGSGSTYGHLLTLESLIHLISELVNVNFSRTLTIGSVNLAKLTNVYVKTIDITDEMRAEDALIDQKLPFVQCESADDGAMLITDYALLKHWTIK